MKFQAVLPKSVQKEMDRLPDEIANRILKRLTELETNPRSGGREKAQRPRRLANSRGDYRVIYEIHDRILQIIVITVGHRREVYR